jgi:osmotically inducible protein OsmC
MSIRSASATWNGDLKTGNGSFTSKSGALAGLYTFDTRFGESRGTNPEELIGAAHAACFSMALTADLGRAGFKPTSVTTNADVSLDKVEAGFRITKIKLTTQVSVAGVDAAKLQEIANGTKSTCPISAALAAVPIELEVELLAGAGETAPAPAMATPAPAAAAAPAVQPVA